MAETEPSTIVIAIPGARYMDIQRLQKGRVRITCPGCGAVKMLKPRRGTYRDVAFIHKTKDQPCPVLDMIDRQLLIIPEPSHPVG